MTAEEFRKMALSFSGAVESAHMKHPDFRIEGKIFATLGYPDESCGMVKLTPEQQRSFIKKAPGVFDPCSGVWGQRGATNVYLASAKKDVLNAALDAAWKNVKAKRKKTPPGASPPYFLNVDLEIESKSALRPLAHELGERVDVMFSGRISGRHCLFVETAGAHKSLDGIIQAFCSLIEGLSADSMRVWNAAHRKEFDLGYEARLSSQLANRFKIRPSTLRRVAKLGASLAVTFYREERVDGSASQRNKQKGKKK